MRTPTAAATDRTGDHGRFTPEAIHDRRWWTLVALCSSLVIVIVANTTLNVALPHMRDALGATTTELQWIVDAYALVFAGLLLTAGALGDRFGRKGVLQIGLLILVTASTAAAFSGGATNVTLLRAVMGAGAALIMPSTLSILTNVFPPAERPKAIAIWAGLSGAGAAVGPITSGLLLEHFWWGSVFLVNLPIVAVALVAGHFLVPPSRDMDASKLDPVGAVLSIIGLVALVYAIIEAPNHGWGSGQTIATFGAAAVLLAGFCAWELRSRAPMLDLRYFRNPRFGFASMSVSLVFFAMFGMFFLMTQYFQLVLGYGALETGVRLLPVAITMVAVAPNSARLVARLGTRAVVTVGMLLVAVGLALIGRSTSTTQYWYIVMTMVTVAGGMGLTIPSMTASIMSSVPLGKAGVGSAVNDTTRELGGALGVAVLGSALAGRYADSLAGSIGTLPGPLQAIARGSLGGALEVARNAGAAGGPLANAAREAYVDGMRLALFIGASVVFVAAFLAYRFLPSREAGEISDPAAHVAPAKQRSSTSEPVPV